MVTAEHADQTSKTQVFQITGAAAGQTHITQLHSPIHSLFRRYREASRAHRQPVTDVALLQRAGCQGSTEDMPCTRNPVELTTVHSQLI